MGLLRPFCAYPHRSHCPVSTAGKCHSPENGRALTTANCPEKYQELAVHIFKLKLLFPYLTQAQIDYVKYSTIDPEAGIAIPAEIARAKRDDLDRIANAINTVSLTVSQFPSFNQMIVTVLDICDGK